MGLLVAAASSIIIAFSSDDPWQVAVGILSISLMIPIVHLLFKTAVFRMLCKNFSHVAYPKLVTFFVLVSFAANVFLGFLIVGVLMTVRARFG